MKIIVHKNEEVICYVQLRDLIYLADKKDNIFRTLSLKFIDEFKTMSDFVKISDIELIKLIEKREDIIDFSAFVAYSNESLTKLLVAKNLFCNSDEASRRVKHETQAIQDVISYKKGELDYNIPLIADDRIVEKINGYVVMSTNFNDKFIVKYDISMFPDFVCIIDSIKKVAMEHGLLDDAVDYSYKITYVEDYAVLLFLPIVKKKNILQRVFHKKTDF